MYNPNTPNDPNNLKIPNNPANPYQSPYTGIDQSPRMRARRMPGCSCIAYLLVLTILVVAAGGCISWWAVPFILSNDSVLSTLDPLIPRISFGECIALSLGIGAVVFFIVMLFSAMSSRVMRRSGSTRVNFFGALLFAVTVGTLSFLFSTFLSGIPYTTMTRTGFTSTDISITTGTVIHVRNAADNVPQFLCIGQNQQCQSENGAPSELNHGVWIQPGQSMTFAFDNDGSYKLTSKTTPDMNLQVTASSDTGG